MLAVQIVDALTESQTIHEKMLDGFRDVLLHVHALLDGQFHTQTSQNELEVNETDFRVTLTHHGLPFALYDLLARSLHQTRLIELVLFRHDGWLCISRIRGTNMRMATSSIISAVIRPGRSPASNINYPIW